MNIQGLDFVSIAGGRICSVTFCEVGQLRKRKVVMRSRARATGKFPSWKNMRMMQWESLNELNGFTLLDLDPHVKAYSEQPCEILYINCEGRIASHIPDVACELLNTKELIEVKPAYDAHSEPVQTRTTLLTEDLPRFGYRYRVWLAEDLARQPRLKNARKILYFGRRPMGELERVHLQQAIHNEGLLTWGTACAGTYGKYGREILCRGVLEGVLQFDVNAPFTSETTFRAGTLEVM